MHFSKCGPTQSLTACAARKPRLHSLVGVLLQAGFLQDGFLQAGFSNLEMSRESDLRRYYRALYRAWGAQHWWPADSPFEVIVGAFLTQNTTWANVERALVNLRSAHLLSVEGIRSIPVSRLETLIRSSGYFRQKAQRLKAFVAFLDAKYRGSLDLLFSRPTDKLRDELLGLNGVGPETADSILLYAGNHPVFVVDAYTRRILDRHGMFSNNADYEEIRELFQRALPPLARKSKPAQAKLGRQIDHGSSHPPSAMSTAPRPALVQIYNEMHGLIVGVGKHYCGKSQPKCDGCPLQPFLPANK
jgi:endonuclease III related protein